MYAEGIHTGITGAMAYPMSNSSNILDFLRTDGNDFDENSFS